MLLLVWSECLLETIMFFHTFLASLFYFGLCEVPTVLLNDGNSMPTLGLGTFLGFDEYGQKDVEFGEVETPVSWAIENGYRLIDTAASYNNEDEIGRAIQRASVPREHIFLVTKLGSDEQRNVPQALMGSLARLNTSYVDLYLIHNPVAFKANESVFDIVDYVDTWRGMEEVKRNGLAKSIGISNFNISQMERLLANCEIRPAVLQVEVNLNLAQNEILEFTKKNDITVIAYTPFGSIFSKEEHPPPKLDDPSLVEMATKYGKSVAQIILRYLTQRSVVPIPKSVKKEKISQNIDIFDFELTAEEMKILAAFNKDYRTVWPSFWQDHPYYPFEHKDVPDPDIFHKNKKA